MLARLGLGGHHRFRGGGEQSEQSHAVEWCEQLNQQGLVCLHSLLKMRSPRENSQEQGNSQHR